MRTSYPNNKVSFQTCKDLSPPEILFGWGHDGFGFDLPPNVSIRVYRRENMLVLQVHYLIKTKERDYTGVRVRYQTERYASSWYE